jgi:hypothetical protein
MKYNIPEDHESVIFRLFVDGNPEPIQMEEDDTLVFNHKFSLMHSFSG